VETSNLFNELKELYPEEALTTFIKEFSENDLNHFEESYMGEWESKEEFMNETFEDLYEIPSYIVIDYESTWDSAFRHDYIHSNGFIFNVNF